MSQDIEGLPEGVKISRIGPAHRGEYVLYLNDGIAKPEIMKADIGTLWSAIVIAADNVYDLVDLSQAKIPEGFTRGPFDIPSEDEWGLDVDGRALKFNFNPRILHGDQRRIILIPKKTKRVMVIEYEVSGNESVPPQLRVEYHGERLKILSHRIEERKP